MADLFAHEEIDVTLELEEGQARCDFCQGDYSVQLQVICGECERTLCPLCATWLRRIYRCPECVPTQRVALPTNGLE